MVDALQTGLDAMGRLTVSSRDARTRREKRTLAVMVEMYCKAFHGGKSTSCTECRDLLEYATKRVDRCPFLDAKPTCAKCRVHCYDARRRDQIRAVMRHSGPRMMYRHPMLATRHMIDGRMKVQEEKKTGDVERS